jgi:hypothetical protein
MSIIYLAVPGRDNVFVSENGEVLTNKNGKGYPRKLTLDKSNGYMVVNINYKKTYVHRLVAETWVKNPEGHSVINHKDSNRTNNTKDNLEWCSYKENNVHMVAAGRWSHIETPVLAVADDNTGHYFKSIAEAVRHGFNGGNLQRAINTNTKCSGFRWYKMEQV